MGAIAEHRPFPPALGVIAAAALLLAGLLALGGQALRGSVSADGSAAASIARAPLSFEPNAGRLDEGVAFVSRSVGGGSLFLGRGEATLVIPQGKRAARELRLGLIGAAPSAPVGIAELPGKANSFIGDDRSGWRSGIPTYGGIRYRSIYPGIDLDFHGSQSELEYDYRLSPGSDPSQIGIGLKGADSLRLDRAGDLLIGLGGTTVRQHAPFAYQWVDGERRRVAAAFDLRETRLGFELGRYDRSRPLVIDPVITYSTYLGGSDDDFGFDIAVDSKGAVYLSGQTESGDFPLKDEKFPDQALADAYVAKFNPDANGKMTLAYSTYLGASLDDGGGSIAVDDQGAVYVAGATASTNFPTVDPLAGAAGGNLASFDCYVAKISPDSGGAVALEYSTYISGSVTDVCADIAVDTQGAAYVTGSTDSTDFPTQDEFQGNQKDGDSFVTKLNPDNGGPVTLAYSTYMGGSANQDRLGDIAVDSQGAAYVTGSTDSTDFPTQDPVEIDKLGFDALAIKINPDTGGPVTLAYSTYLGGSQSDTGIGIAVDSKGAAHIVGVTGSTDFPTQFAYETNQAEDDAFALELLPDTGGTVTIAYSTYLGAAKFDSAQGIALDSEDNTIVAGTTESEEFPLSIDPLQGNLPGRDAFVAKLSQVPGKNAELDFSTYLGGDGSDEGNEVAVDGVDAVYLTGTTKSTDFPTRNEFSGPAGGFDAYLLKLGEPPAVLAPGQKKTGAPPGDLTAPDTAIATRPKGTVRTKRKRARVSFGFSSSEPGSHFECALDRSAFSACSSPGKYRVVSRPKPRKHLFRVRAIDAAGNVDPSPAEARFKVRRKRPSSS